MNPRTVLHSWEKYSLALIRIQSAIPRSSNMYPGHYSGFQLTREMQKSRSMDRLLQEFCGRSNWNLMQENVKYLTVRRRFDWDWNFTGWTQGLQTALNEWRNGCKVLASSVGCVKELKCRHVSYEMWRYLYQTTWRHALNQSPRRQH